MTMAVPFCYYNRCSGKDELTKLTTHLKEGLMSVGLQLKSARYNVQS